MGLNMGTAMLIGQGVGAVGSAFGASQSASAMQNSMQTQSVLAQINARSAQSMAEAQANIDDINADTSEFAAQQAIIAGQRNEQNVLLKGAQLKSTQRAEMAANGIDLSQGSAQNILTSTDVMTREDAKQVALEATRAAWGLRTQATNYKSAAGVSRAQGQAAVLQGYAQAAGLNATASAISPSMAGASSLLTSAASIGGQWSMMKSVGLLDKKKWSMDDFIVANAITKK